MHNSSSVSWKTQTKKKAESFRNQEKSQRTLTHLIIAHLFIFDEMCLGNLYMYQYSTYSDTRDWLETHFPSPPCTRIPEPKLLPTLIGS